MNDLRTRNPKVLRFSLRSLLIATLVVGLYFACGPLTKGRGVADVTKYQRANQLHEITPEYVAPLVLKCWVSTHSQANRATTITTTYYVWFFGFVKLLPFERVEIEPDVIGKQCSGAPILDARQQRILLPEFGTARILRASKGRLHSGGGGTDRYLGALDDLITNFLAGDTLDLLAADQWQRHQKERRL